MFSFWEIHSVLVSLWAVAVGAACWALGVESPMPESMEMSTLCRTKGTGNCGSARGSGTQGILSIQTTEILLWATLSECLSVGCVGSQAGHPWGHWSCLEWRGLDPSWGDLTVTARVSPAQLDRKVSMKQWSSQCGVYFLIIVIWGWYFHWFCFCLLLLAVSLLILIYSYTSICSVSCLLSIRSISSVGWISQNNLTTFIISRSSVHYSSWRPSTFVQNIWWPPFFSLLLFNWDYQSNANGTYWNCGLLNAKEKLGNQIG